MSRQFSMDVGAPLAHHWLRFIRLAAIGLGILLLGSAQVHAGPPGQAEAILRAHLDAGSIGTVVAAKDVEGTLCSRMNALLQVLNPGLVHPHRIGMLRLARHGAGVTADTAAIVDDETKSG